MRKKLLVCGGAGFVAGSVIVQALREWDVYALDIIENAARRNNLTFYTLDLTDFDQLSDLYHQINPDAVIHTAALADIDYCESNRDMAEKINVGITKNLLMLCKKNNAKLIFCSTDTVFDGETGDYKEKDIPRPLNFYAETKVRAENLIREEDANAVISRLSLVMGLPVMGSGNSFVARTIEKLKSAETVEFPANEIRTPLDVITLGAALIELAANDFTGTIHLAGNDRINRYEMARQLAAYLGYSSGLIIAGNSNKMPDRARRPNDVSLDNRQARQILNTPMLSFADGLNLTINFNSQE